MTMMQLVVLFSALVGSDSFSVRPVGRPLTSLQAQIGLFFGTSTGNTEEAADLIAASFPPGTVEGPIDIDGIQGSVAEEFAKHDALIVGTPTWNTGADTERSGTGWDEIYYGEMQDLQLQGRKVAVFGLGDSVSYSENYADASGELHDVFEKLGCNMMGYTSQEGYEHDDSKAIRGDLFCGLLLDAVNQEDLTEERVKNWVEQLQEEGILEGSATAATAMAPTAVTVDVEVMEKVTINGSEHNVIAKLEEENAKLRKMIEEKSNMLDESASAPTATGFTTHFNPTTKRTMWTSGDGRKCYFTY
jgi:flavodoxin I